MIDGTTGKIKMFWEGNTLVANVTGEKGLAVTKRTIEGGKLILVTTCKGATMKRIFKREAQNRHDVGNIHDVENIHDGIKSKNVRII